MAGQRREHRRRREDLEGRRPAVEVLEQEGQRRDVVEVGVRQHDAPDAPLRGERQRLGQRTGVQRRLAVEQERRHPVAGRRAAVGPERADGQ